MESHSMQHARARAHKSWNHAQEQIRKQLDEDAHAPPLPFKRFVHSHVGHPWTQAGASADEALLLTARLIIYIYIYIYIYTYIHTYIHIYIYIEREREMFIQTYMHTYIHTCHTYIITYIHTCMHAYIHNIHVMYNTYNIYKSGSWAPSHARPTWAA